MFKSEVDNRQFAADAYSHYFDAYCNAMEQLRQLNRENAYEIMAIASNHEPFQQLTIDEQMSLTSLVQVDYELMSCQLGEEKHV